MHLARRSPRGTTLIEAMISLTVLLIGMAGFAGLQPVISRANQFSKRVTAASMVATDLEENIHRWAYTDSRLVTPVAVLGPCNTSTMAGCFADPTNVTPLWDLGRATSLPYTPHFSDADLGTFQGVTADVDRDGTTEFFRYWNVFDVDPKGTGVPNGKLVQIIVRWKEPTFGYRQITSGTFKLNPAAAFEQ